jgi:hypothetical protein
VQKPQTQQQQRLMKMSHFSIGREGADMINPKPVQPVEPSFKIGDLNIDEQRTRLT